jgi:hypothetical protein
MADRRKWPSLEVSGEARMVANARAPVTPGAGWWYPELLGEATDE